MLKHEETMNESLLLWYGWKIEVGETAWQMVWLLVLLYFKLSRVWTCLCLCWFI